MKKKTKPSRKLADFIEAAKVAGAHVTFGLKPRKMPIHLENDDRHVTLLLEESERMTKLGNTWLQCENPNTIAAEVALRSGWAHALSAAWLRCKLNGELLPESEQKKKAKAQ